MLLLTGPKSIVQEVFGVLNEPVGWGFSLNPAVTPGIFSFQVKAI